MKRGHWLVVFDVLGISLVFVCVRLTWACVLGAALGIVVVAAVSKLDGKVSR